MKKILALSAVLICMGMGAMAQVTQKGSGTFQLGYGFPSSIYLMNSFFRYFPEQGSPYATTKFRYRGIGPVHLRYERMFSDRIGAGLSINGELGKFRFNATYPDADNNLVTSQAGYRLKSVSGLLRVNYHFIKNPEIVDIYFGLGVGYAYTVIQRDSLTGVNPETPDEKVYNDEFEDYLNSVLKKLPVAFEAVIGIKYPLGNFGGVYAEAGYGKSLFQFGVYGKIGNRKGFSRDDWKWYKRKD